MHVPAPDDSAEDIGACEAMPPQVFIIDGGPETIQPTTHASRCCSSWFPNYGDDEGGDGEPIPKPSPEPDRDKVRRLFPNPPPQPVAA